MKKIKYIPGEETRADFTLLIALCDKGNLKLLDNYKEARKLMAEYWEVYGILPERGDYIADDDGNNLRVVGRQWHTGGVFEVWLSEKMQ